MASKIVEWVGSPMVNRREISKKDWSHIEVEAPSLVWERQPGPAVIGRYKVGDRRFNHPVVVVEDWNDDLEAYFEADADFKVHDSKEAPAKPAR